MIEAKTAGKRGEIIRKGIGGLMILAGLLLLAAALADSKIGVWLSPPSPSAGSASLSGISRLLLGVENGEIRIIAEERPDLAVAIEGSNPGRMGVELRRQGDELQVKISAPWWHRQRLSQLPAVEIRLPEGFAGVVTAEVGRGSLTFTGGSPDRTVRLQALELQIRTGRAEIRQVRLGRLNYSGRTGALLMDGVEAGEATLRQVTGQIELVHFAGALKSHQTSGSLQAQFDRLSGPVTLELVTGKLALSLPSTGAGYTLDGRVGRGRIQSDLRLEGSAGQGENEVRGTHGDGLHAVNLQVTTGSVEIR